MRVLIVSDSEFREKEQALGFRVQYQDIELGAFKIRGFFDTSTSASTLVLDSPKWAVVYLPLSVVETFINMSMNA